MNLTAVLRKSFTTSPMLAAAAYAGLVLVLLAAVVSSIVDVLGQRAAVAASAAMLEQLDGRKVAAAGGRSADASMPSGSAFLEGATVTIAGAAHTPDGLVLTVQDDSDTGDSSPTWTPGVGLRSMQDRATELCGTLCAEPTPTGGRVHARLPLVADR